MTRKLNIVPAFFLRKRFVFFLVLGVFLVMNFGRGLIDTDEGRYAEIPREMVESGNWMEMRILEYRYYEKPPLAYWLTAIPMAVFGPHDWAARIPLFFNLAAIALLFYFTLRQYWPKDMASSIMLVSLTGVGSVAGMSLLMTDPFLSLFFGISCLAPIFWAKTSTEKRRTRCLLVLISGVSFALGFLTKGAIAVVLPGAIIFIWMVLEKRWNLLKSVFFLQTAGLFLLIVCSALWFIEKHNPGFVKHFIWEEHIARFAGTRKTQGHPEPFWFYGTVIPLFLAPWSLFIFRAGRIMYLKRVWSTDSLTKLFFIWTGVVVLFFSLSTGKLMSYILPAVMPMFLLLGRWGVAEPFDGTSLDRRLIYLGILGVVLLPIVLTTGCLLSYLDLIPKAVPSLNTKGLLALIPLLIALPALYSLRSSVNFLRPLILLNATTMLTTALLLSHLPDQNFNFFFYRNSSKVYKALGKEMGPLDRIVVFWGYRPSLAFYTQRVQRVFQDQNELLYGMRMEPERPGELQTLEALDEFIKETLPGKVYAVVEPRRIKTLSELQIEFKETDLPENPRTVILELPAD